MENVMPVRVQRKRSPGWQMPPNTVYVGRPSKWGNPYLVGVQPYDGDDGQTIEEVMFAYRHLQIPKLKVALLRGKNLACWCPLDQPCHGDILLELANEGLLQLEGLDGTT